MMTTVRELLKDLSDLDPDLPVYLEVSVYTHPRSRRAKIARLAIEEVCVNVTVPDVEGQEVDPDHVTLTGYQERYGAWS